VNLPLAAGCPVLLLALESATSDCSAAVCDGAGEVLGYRSGAREPAQADLLVALIDAAVDAAAIDYPDLDLIAVNHGPGSFTGVRAGVAAARALALALARPVLAVNSLEVIAAGVGARPAGTVVAALDARRGQVYVQAFDHRLVALGPPSALAPEDDPLGKAQPPLCLAGSGAALLSVAFADARPVMHAGIEADARFVARRALARLAAGERPIEGRQVQPLYLRPPDARLPTLPRAPTGAAVGA
jgi:tRNA threonylcarbamoyladenosine biosynthesis protein TsaB